MAQKVKFKHTRYKVNCGKTQTISKFLMSNKFAWGREGGGGGRRREGGGGGRGREGGGEEGEEKVCDICATTLSSVIPSSSVKFFKYSTPTQCKNG